MAAPAPEPTCGGAGLENADFLEILQKYVPKEMANIPLDRLSKIVGAINEHIARRAPEPTGKGDALADEIVEACAKSCESQAKDHFDAAKHIPEGNTAKEVEGSTKILRYEGAAAIACAVRIRTEHKGRYALRAAHPGPSPAGE